MSTRTCPWAATGPGSAAGRMWSGKTPSLALVAQALPIVCSSLLLFHGCVRHRVSSAGSLLLRDPLSRDPAVPCSSSTTYFLFLSHTSPACLKFGFLIWASTGHRSQIAVRGGRRAAGRAGRKSDRQGRAVVLSYLCPTAAGSVGWLNRNETWI